MREVLAGVMMAVLFIALVVFGMEFIYQNIQIEQVDHPFFNLQIGR